MAGLFSSIDIEEAIFYKEFIYRLSGWCGSDKAEDISFRVRTDLGEEVAYEHNYVNREDVKATLNQLKTPGEKMGFDIMITGLVPLFGHTSYIQLVAIHGEMEEVICQKNMSEIEQGYQRYLFQHKLDYAGRRGSRVIINGWVYHMKGSVEITVTGPDAQQIEYKLLRMERKDVAEAYALQADDLIGFRVEIPREAIHTKHIELHFASQGEEQGEDIDILTLDKNSTPKGRIWNKLTTEGIGNNIGQIRKQGWKKYKTGLQALYYEDETEYETWFAAHRATAKQLKQQSKEHFAYEPLISIAIPLYNTPLDFLEDMIHSVVHQSYQNWELCLADGSTDTSVEAYISSHYGGEQRIKYEKLTRNEGIAGNTNAALGMASGEFIMLTDHDDVLELDALYEMVKAINEDGTIDIVYTDEDLTDETGSIYSSPRFKPDYNLDFLRSINYICHIFMVRKTILDRVGGFREEFDGAQDWDLILRCCEKSRGIHHVPKILYHWRAHQASTAGNPESKSYAIDAGRRALEQHYKRCGIQAELEYTDIFIMFRARLKVLGEPKVSIIIPNKDQVETLSTCVNSILEKSTYQNYEIVIVENNSCEPGTYPYYEELKREHPQVKVVYYEGGFNYSKINNFGAKNATGEYYILLNNDTEVITPNWMEQMLGYCQREDVGIVGAKLLYPDNTVQHCGVVVGVGGFAGHILTQSRMEDAGYFGRLQAVADTSAVTAACLMIKKTSFDEVQGLDEEFTVALNDIDLCLKVRKTGKLVVMNPGVCLYHYESKSRGMEETPEKHERFKKEIRRFRTKWSDILTKGDPYYNENLTLMYGDCSIRSRFEHFDIIDEIEQEA